MHPGSLPLLILLLAVVAYGQDPPAKPADALFGALPAVEVSALHSGSLEEAPASVTVITADDIHKYGYRTLNEVLTSVRGFFSTTDRAYDYVGVRGFSYPGDYNTRFLVMLNGHPMTDQVYGSNGAFAQDLGLDMDLVDRIEIIRGPTSALYGSNGILANINIVTKSPVDMDRLRVSTETGSFGEKKGILTSSLYLGKGANLLVSASIYNDTGEPLRFPGIPGTKTGVDGEKGYHLFADLVWHNWSLTAFFNDREQQPPVPWAPQALPFQRGDNVSDSRNYFLASYTHAAGGGDLRWQIYYDQYRYHDRFYYPSEASSGIEDWRSVDRGDSVGTQLDWQKQVPGIGALSLGVETDLQLQNLQQVFLAYPALVYSPAISHPDRTGAVFAQQQWKIGGKLAIYGGVRFAESLNFGGATSPSLALVYQWSPKTTYKFMYGRPFRNPSAFEDYFSDGVTLVANGKLRPEIGRTFEVSFERKLLPHVSLIGNAYDYRIDHVIEADVFASGLASFENSAYGQSRGAEVEIAAKAWKQLEAVGSYSFNISKDDGTVTRINVPQHIAKFRSAAPFWGGRLTLAGSLQYMNSRQTPLGAFVRPVALGDVTISTNRLSRDFDLVAGVRNIANWRYSDPVIVAIDSMPGAGRSFFIKLIYHTRE